MRRLRQILARPPRYVHHKQPANTLVEPRPSPFPPLDDTQASAVDDATNAQLNDLQAALSKLSKKALQEINNLLDDPNARVQM